MKDNWEDENDLSEAQKREIEKSMEKRIHRQCLIGDIIEFFVLILIVFAIFFPSALKCIYRMILGVTELIL